MCQGTAASMADTHLPSLTEDPCSVERQAFQKSPRQIDAGYKWREAPCRGTGGAVRGPGVEGRRDLGVGGGGRVGRRSDISSNT